MSLLFNILQGVFNIHVPGFAVKIDEVVIVGVSVVAVVLAFVFVILVVFVIAVVK